MPGEGEAKVSYSAELIKGFMEMEGVIWVPAKVRELLPWRMNSRARPMKVREMGCIRQERREPASRPVIQPPHSHKKVLEGNGEVEVGFDEKWGVPVDNDEGAVL